MQTKLVYSRPVFSQDRGHERAFLYDDRGSLVVEGQNTPYECNAAFKMLQTVVALDSDCKGVVPIVQVHQSQAFTTHVRECEEREYEQYINGVSFVRPGLTN